MLMRRNVATGMGSNEQGEYCRAALQRSDRKEPRYKWPTLLFFNCEYNKLTVNTSQLIYKEQVGVKSWRHLLLMLAALHYFIFIRVMLYYCFNNFLCLLCLLSCSSLILTPIYYVQL